MYYYTIAKHYPERVPKTWAEFERLIIQRFCSKTPVEVMHKLMSIKYRGSVSEVTDQFSRACAEGDQLPQEKLLRLYLSRFPKKMAKRVMKRGFSTWVEASEFMLNEDRTLTSELAEWYQLAPPEFKREVETDKQCVREGWILKNPTSLPKLENPEVVPKPAGRANGTSRLVPEATRGSFNKDKPSFNQFLDSLMCHSCNGKGHRAKECPSQDPSTRRDNSKCRKCGGLGHWASACPSPENRANFRDSLRAKGEHNRQERGPTAKGNGQA